MSRFTHNAEPVRIMRSDAPDIVMVDAAEYGAYAGDDLPAEQHGDGDGLPLSLG